MVADSISPGGKRIMTFELEYQRFIHGEVMTHRVFSRNAMSSRAIPVEKMIKQVKDNPAAPIHWGKNQPGMQANVQLEGDELLSAQVLWNQAAANAAKIAKKLSDLGAHKQVANRILEPFQWMRTLVTATEWDNFFELRAHPDAQPEFQVLATKMQEAMLASTPVLRQSGSDNIGDHNNWHLPYISDEERENIGLRDLVKICTARCARVSYLTHGGDNPRNEEDIALYERLVGSVPIHASPTEHAAMCAINKDFISKNFKGWYQFREIVESQIRSNPK